MTPEQARQTLAGAELLSPAAVVAAAVERIAAQVSATLGERNPLVLAVMGGAVVFAGALLPRLAFPLEFDFVHVSRYNDDTSGGELRWRISPDERVSGRCVLVLDDVLDEGVTLAAVKARLLELGASACHTAVMVDKDLGRDKPIRADFVGLTLPDRYLFGYGMDIAGYWRNLPEIYALKREHRAAPALED